MVLPTSPATSLSPPRGGAPASPQPLRRRGPPGWETPGSAARSRPAEMPLRSDNTAAISGSPDSHFACQQIHVSETRPLCPSHASSVLGSWQGNCDCSLQRPASRLLTAWFNWASTRDTGPLCRRRWPWTFPCPAGSSERPGCLLLRALLPGSRRASRCVAKANRVPRKTVPPASTEAFLSSPTQAQTELQNQTLLTSNSLALRLHYC